MDLGMANGFANVPVDDIFDLLGAYSHRPIVEDNYKYVHCSSFFCHDNNINTSGEILRKYAIWFEWNSVTLSVVDQNYKNFSKMFYFL